MIEFTPDGPYSEKANQLFPGRVRILGLGQVGAAVCDQLVLHGRPGQDLWVFDTDQLSIEGSVVPNRHLLGSELVHGLGCSGDLEMAREIVAMEEAHLKTATHGCDFLVLALGLAGSTGVALAERLIELAHEAGAKVIVVGVQPFAFEGPARRERAIQSISDLRAEADSVLVLAHDRIAEDPVTQKNIRHGFHLMHQLMSQTAQALAQVVCKRGLIQLSFADVRSLYGRYTTSEVLENCWAAHVEGDLHDRMPDLVGELLDQPLLRDESVWKQVDHAIIAISGTRDLGLSEVQEMVSAFKEKLPVNIPIATSASLDEDNHDKVRMTVLLATTAPALLSMPEIVAAAEKPPRAKKPRPLAETAPLPELKAKSKIELEPPITTPQPKKSPVAKKPVHPPAPVSLPVEPEPVALVGEDEEELPPVPKLEIHVPVTAPVAATEQPNRRFLAKQEEMTFEGPSRGRFEKTHETMYRGENLDQPTYRRRGLKIKV